MRWRKIIAGWELLFYFHPGTNALSLYPSIANNFQKASLISVLPTINTMWASNASHVCNRQFSSRSTDNVNKQQGEVNFDNIFYFIQVIQIIILILYQIFDIWYVLNHISSALLATCGQWLLHGQQWSRFLKYHQSSIYSEPQNGIII